MDYEYDSDATEYYPDIDNPNTIIIELSKSVVYIDKNFTREELINEIKDKIINLNIEYYDTKNENLKNDLENYRELYFFIINNLHVI